MKLKALNTWTQQLHCRTCKSTTPHTVTVYNSSTGGLTERKCHICGETVIALNEKAVPA